MYDRTILPNGLRIVSSTMPHVRSVSTGIFVGAGSRYEDERTAGASHFLEHMLFKGSEKRPEPQLISGAIESVGGIFNASTDREATIYYTKVGRDHFDVSLDVLIDMYRSPLFISEELERERGVIIEELAMTYDQPDAFADLLIDEALWPDQPMGRDIGGTRETVSGITRQQLIDYHALQYIPGNTVIAVAGNISHEEVVDKVGALLGDQTGVRTLPMYEVDADDARIRVRVGSKRTDQAHICLAVNGPSAEASDRYIVDMMNTVLGEGMTSRLFMEIRERRGLAYDVHSSAINYRGCGAIVIGCGVDNAKADATIEALVVEVDKIQQGVAEQEVSRAVEYAVGRLQLRMEDSRAVMAWFGGQELLRDEVRTPDQVVADLRHINDLQIVEAARRYFGPRSFRLSVVGPFRSWRRFERLLVA